MTVSKRWWTTGIPYIDLIYWPYTGMSISFLVIGAMFSDTINWERFGILLLSWLIGVGFLSHVLDELQGHPLNTGIPDKQLKIIALIAVFLTLSLFIYLGIFHDWTFILIYFILLFFALAYNSELFSGQFHRDMIFVICFAEYPLFLGFYGMGLTIPPLSLIILFIGLGGVASVETVVNHFVKFNSKDFQHAYDKDFAYLQRAVWGAVWTSWLLAIGLFLWRIGF